MPKHAKDVCPVCKPYDKAASCHSNYSGYVFGVCLVLPLQDFFILALFIYLNFKKILASPLRMWDLEDSAAGIKPAPPQGSVVLTTRTAGKSGKSFT